MDFLNYLVKRGIINEATSEKIVQTAKKSGKDISEVLLKEGIDRESIFSLKADYLQIPARSLNPQEVPPEVLKHIPEESAEHYGFIPIGLADGVLEVGMVDPDNLEARDALQFIATKFGKPFKLFLITRQDFDALLESYHGLTGEVHRALTELGEESIDSAKRGSRVPEEAAAAPQEEAKLLGDQTALSPGGSEGENVIPVLKQEEPAMETRDEVKIVEETPITKIVSVILRHAVEGGASDIHIEHTGERVQVRFRVDGRLYTSLLLPKTVHDSVVARIKVLSNLRLDERRKPQDGSFRIPSEGGAMDFRVSTFPAYFGEKIAIRILDPEKGIKKLEATGLRAEDLARVRNALSRPYGLILLTGPTGSGKSTTLYAMMNELDREKENVVSLEDPVEYTILGVSQSQVRPEINYTFATGLRSIVRQDPDIIMVGEIRDEETARLAIQAALTGHLVFSTLHTNNATGAVPRLMDMGIEPYLIALTLVLVLGQRLIPKMCEASKKPVPIEGALKTSIEKAFEGLPKPFLDAIAIPKQVYEAVPSSGCPGGTRGRIGAFELLEIGRELEEVILKKPSEQELLLAARKKGMLTMKEDALLKAFAGEISIREVNQFE